MELFDIIFMEGNKTLGIAVVIKIESAVCCGLTNVIIVEFYSDIEEGSVFNVDGLRLADTKSTHASIEVRE